MKEGKKERIFLYVFLKNKEVTLWEGKEKELNWIQ